MALEFGSNAALSLHSLGDLEEACDVGACYEVILEAVLVGSLDGSLEDVSHNVLELGIDFLGSPAETLAVLAHLETGNSNAAGVNCLGRSNDNAVLLEVLNSLVGGRHISDLNIVLDTVSNDLLSLSHADLVLSSAGHQDVSLNAPGLLTLEELSGGELVGVILNAVAAGSSHIQEVIYLLVGGDAVGIVNVAVGAGDGNYLAAQLVDLLNSTPSNVAETGDSEGLALDGILEVVEHIYGVVNSAVAGSLGTDQGAAVGDALTGENAGELVLESLVLAEEEADLSAAYADITGGNVGIGADVSVELGHEALAEAHNLSIGLALGVEVRAALAAAHGEGGQAVLEGLLEAEELDDADIYVGSKSQTALVGSDSRVELNSETAVNLELAVVVYPGNTENDLPLGLDHSVDNARLYEIGPLLYNGLDALEDLVNGLQELGLTLIALLDLRKHALEILILKCHCQKLLLKIFLMGIRFGGNSALYSFKAHHDFIIIAQSFRICKS